ncbi:hypothetical protein IFM89_036887 [Coptis chinensis]|uniref:Uncharacterized protein n=1 Tax=Coptis chinensis TaxID=261450 RepID=A0A835LU04_9MAGN|nr:hypothetical protein IFM89_036887 [Coptis chinensis]
MPSSTTSQNLPARTISGGSCDGLLLFQDKYSPHQLYISNPATTYLEALPPFRHGYPISNWALFQFTMDVVVNSRCLGSSFSASSIFLRWETKLLIVGDHIFFLTYVNRKLPSKVLSQIFHVKRELYCLTLDEEGDQLCYCLYTLDVNSLGFRRSKVPRHIVEPCNVNKFTLIKGLHLVAVVKGLLCFV